MAVGVFGVVGAVELMTVGVFAVESFSELSGMVDDLSSFLVIMRLELGWSVLTMLILASCICAVDGSV